jgi:hypothetical protein
MKRLVAGSVEEVVRVPMKHEVKGVRIAPDMDVVLSKFTYPIELAHLCTVLA